VEALDQLPRGRHGLSREEVQRSQRGRMLRAMAEAVSEHGYVKTPVAEVLRRAGVSRETFYEHFANKEECFLAAYDAAATVLLAEVGAAAAGGGGERSPWRRLDAGLARYLAVLAREPALARTFFVEVYAAGPAALARRVEVQQRFVEAAAALAGARGARQRFACEALVAATSALVTQRVCAGATDTLEELHRPLSHHVRSVLEASGLH